MNCASLSGSVTRALIYDSAAGNSAGGESFEGGSVESDSADDSSSEYSSVNGDSWEDILIRMRASLHGRETTYDGASTPINNKTKGNDAKGPDSQKNKNWTQRP